MFVIFVPIGLSMYADKNKAKFSASLSYTLLAIEPPKNNDQSMSAVEKIFVSLTSTYASISDWERIKTGKYNPPISFEIVSLDGYIQFIIRVQSTYAEYVSALFYAQYPECRIYEIADYTDRLPTSFVPGTAMHDCWGAELVLTKPYFVPIRTYTNNSVSFNAKNPNVYDTPFANLLEVLSRLKRGEIIGIQIVATPVDDSWQEAGWKYLKELMGEKPKEAGSTFLGSIVTFIMEFFMGFVQELTSGMGLFASAEAKKEEKKFEPKTSYERNVLMGVESKITKPGYQAVVRLLYVARKEVFNKTRGVVPLLGAIKQFSGLNGFKPGNGTTKGSGRFAGTKAKTLAKSQSDFIKRYRGRSGGSKDPKYFLNVEELTSLFHLPISGIRAPMIARAAARTAEPPSGLPIDFDEASVSGSANGPSVLSAAPAVEEESSPDTSSDDDANVPPGLPVV